MDDDKRDPRYAEQKSRGPLILLFTLVAGALGLWRFHIIQFSSGFDMFPGDRGDARLVTYILEHWYQVFHGNESWISPAMFFPVKGTLGYADILLGYAIPYALLRAAGLDIFGAAEFSIILGNVLNFVVCFVLLNKVLRLNSLASCAGAMFFAFNSPKFAQMSHLQLQLMLFLPLVVIFVVLFVQKAAVLSQKQAFGLLSLAALSLNLQLLTAFYPGWFLIFWGFLFFMLTFFLQKTRLLVISLIVKFKRALAGCLVVFIIGLLPYLAVYLPVIRSHGWRPYQSDIIPEVWSLLLMDQGNYIWGRVSAALRQVHPFGFYWPEHQIGIGLVPSIVWLVISGFSICVIKRHTKAPILSNYRVLNEPGTREVNNLFLALAILATNLFYIIGMNYGNTSSPWHYVYLYFPGARGIRAVARYVMVLALPMSIAFAFAVQGTMQKISDQKRLWIRITLSGLMLLLIFFGLLEQFASSKGGNKFSIKAENNHLQKLTVKLPGDCTSFYVAVGPTGIRGHHEYQIDAMLVSVMRGIPTLNGYSGQLPRDWLMFDIKGSHYEHRVREWIDRHKIYGKVCRLEVTDFLNSTNITDDSRYFVRQQYLDLLGREPDTLEVNHWIKMFDDCAAKAQSCDPADISLVLLRSPEFQEGGYFIYCLYEASLGRPPTYTEFISEMERFNNSEMRMQESATRDAVISEWLQRPDFKTRYDELPSEAYVEEILDTSGIVLPNSTSLISDLANNRTNRAQVLRAVVETQALKNKFYNRAFVSIQYFGHLRRKPDSAGYDDWLRILNETGDYRHVVQGFIGSTEYWQRFAYAD